MSPVACSQTAMVEAFRDRRLGSPERSSMERHLVHCAECAAQLATLERIRQGLAAERPQATPLEHQRARSALLRRAAAPSPAPARMPFGFALAASFAVLFAAAAGFGAARLAAPERASALVSPSFVEATRSALGALAEAPAARPTSLRPSADARFERTLEGTLELVTLAGGALDITVRPLGPEERFVVRTGDAEVEVRGTSFRVEAENSQIRRVSVSEGKVSVRHQGMTATITAGGSWEAADKGALPSEPVVAALAAKTARLPKGAWNTVKQPAPKASASAEPRSEPTPAVPEEAPSAAGLRPASRDFAAAVGSLGAGNYGAAASQLDSFASAYPGDPRAEEAAYLRAITLERAGRREEARDAARAYLAKWPSGAHRAQAAKLLAR
jgi:ferric-dicitrate binding protein FerR (iron transport regulator)